MSAEAALENKLTKIIIERTEFTIEESRADDLKAYALKLRKKFPHLKRNRFMKKVADYFHLRKVL